MTSVLLILQFSSDAPIRKNAKLGKILGRCGFGFGSRKHSDSNARSDSEFNLSPTPTLCKMISLSGVIENRHGGGRGDNSKRMHLVTSGA